MRWLSRFMDLREGEARPAIEALLTLFGIIAGHTILETARDALFPSKLLRDRDELLATFAAYHAIDLGSARLLAEMARICVERPYLDIATPLAARAAESRRAAAGVAGLEVSHGP